MDHQIETIIETNEVKIDYKGSDKKLDKHLNNIAKEHKGEKTKEEEKFGWSEKTYKFKNPEHAGKTFWKFAEALAKWDK